MAKRYYGPFMIEKKISSVAYKLKLPTGSSIFPIFHIALLKPFQGSNLEKTVSLLPPLAIESHPIVVPTKVLAYRQIKHKGKATTQVLVEWAGLPPENKSWEDINAIKRLVLDKNLEDKIAMKGERDVTVTLELDSVVARLKQDLGLTNQEPEGSVSERPNRSRPEKKDDSFIYY